MSAVILALFNDYEAADRVRVDFIRDGFPTDRVELTACCDPGRAALEPASTAHGRFIQYFGALLSARDEAPAAERLTNSLEHGAAAITVHPRGPIETARATTLLQAAQPLELLQHDVANQVLEQAAARHEHSWVRTFWLAEPSDSDCIYCRLFERGGTH